MAEHVYKNNDTWSVEQGSIAPHLDYNKKPKYIIKNCPAQPIIWNNNWCNKKQQFCQNCTDCVVKQVIDKCKEVENIENVETLYDAAQSGMFLQANRILQLFDIEEINK